MLSLLEVTYSLIVADGLRFVSQVTSVGLNALNVALSSFTGYETS